MSDLAKTSQTIDISKYLGRVIQVVHLFFIAYLVWQINQSEELALEKFKEIRNLAYLAYIGLFSAIGVLIAIKKLTHGKQPEFIKSILSTLVISLIFTTFSYFLAKNIADIFNLFR